MVNQIASVLYIHSLCICTYSDFNVIDYYNFIIRLFNEQTNMCNNPPQNKWFTSMSSFIARKSYE